MFVDSHCHLDMLQKSQLELDLLQIQEVVKRANDNDVFCMQTICTKTQDASNIIKIADNFECVYASVGTHPSYVESEEVSSTFLIKTAKENKKIIGFGETGLDYYFINRQISDIQKKGDIINKQKLSFIEHIIASQEMQLPLIVHMRDAEKDAEDIIASEMRNLNFPGLIHCFTSSKDFARKMLDIGFFISLSGIVSFKNAVDLREVVKFIPIDRILIETDAPYLAPVPLRGQTNEPAFLKHTAQAVADIKEISLAEVATKTSENFFLLFAKANRTQDI